MYIMRLVAPWYKHEVQSSQKFNGVNQGKRKPKRTLLRSQPIMWVKNTIHGLGFIHLGEIRTRYGHTWKHSPKCTQSHPIRWHEAHFYNRFKHNLCQTLIEQYTILIQGWLEGGRIKNKFRLFPLAMWKIVCVSSIVPAKEQREEFKPTSPWIT